MDDLSNFKSANCPNENLFPNERKFHDLIPVERETGFDILICRSQLGKAESSYLSIACSRISRALFDDDGLMLRSTLIRRIRDMAARSLRSRTVDSSGNAGTSSISRSSSSRGRAASTQRVQLQDQKKPVASKRKLKTANASASKKRVRLETPEAVQEGVSSRSSDKHLLSGKDPLPLDRPAEPHRTNAPLVTPKGSRIITYTESDLGKSPSVTGLPRPTTTTGQILEDACAHLVKVEPRLQALIDKYPCPVFCPESLAEECDPFKNLCSGIMAQQVSGAAAASIKRKFIGLFHPPPPSEADAQVKADDLRFPTPAEVAACSVPFLRQAGLSERKAEYIQGLGAKFAGGELSASMLINASDEEVLEKLTAVRGLGRWSVEMFACFGLKRMDVLSTGDLGVQ